MFSENRKSIGNSSTGSVALLVGALIVSPAFLIALRPFGNVSRWLTTVYTASGMALAWVCYLRPLHTEYTSAPGTR